MGICARREANIRNTSASVSPLEVFLKLGHSAPIIWNQGRLALEKRLTPRPLDSPASQPDGDFKKDSYRIIA